MSQNQPSNARGEPFWHNLLHKTTDHYDLSKQMEQEQQVYRENRLAQHISPHLLDQAISLIRLSGF